MSESLNLGGYEPKNLLEQLGVGSASYQQLEEQLAAARFKLSAIEQQNEPQNQGMELAAQWQQHAQSIDEYWRQYLATHSEQYETQLAQVREDLEKAQFEADHAIAHLEKNCICSHYRLRTSQTTSPPESTQVSGE